MTLRTMLPAVLAVLAVACGTPRDPEGPRPPRLSLRGTLQSLTSMSTTQPVRLAMVWYSNPDSLIPAQPPAIVSSDVAYSGTFPIAYTLDLQGPPPAAALQTYYAGGKSYRRAIGLLVAYQDDGDGRLNAVPVNGSAADVVLGASVTDVTDWSAGSHVVYTDDEGYQLFQAGAAVSAATPVAVSLTQSPELVLFVCEQLFTWPQVPAALGTACAAAPAHPALKVYGHLTRHASSEAVFFDVTDGIHVLPQAHVLVNGTALAWSATFSGFTGDAAPALVAGSNAFSVSAGALGTVSGAVDVPAAVVLQHPVEGQHVDIDQPLDIEWSGGAGNFEVMIWDVSASSYGPLIYENQTTQHGLAVSELSFVGPGALGVYARGTTFSAPNVTVEGDGAALVNVSFGH